MRFVDLPAVNRFMGEETVMDNTMDMRGCTVSGTALQDTPKNPSGNPTYFGDRVPFFTVAPTIVPPTLMSGTFSGKTFTLASNTSIHDDVAPRGRLYAIQKATPIMMASYTSRTNTEFLGVEWNDPVNENTPLSIVATMTTRCTVPESQDVSLCDFPHAVFESGSSHLFYRMTGSNVAAHSPITRINAETHEVDVTNVSIDQNTLAFTVPQTITLLPNDTLRLFSVSSTSVDVRRDLHAASWTVSTVVGQQITCTSGSDHTTGELGNAIVRLEWNNA